MFIHFFYFTFFVTKLYKCFNFFKKCDYRNPTRIYDVWLLRILYGQILAMDSTMANTTSLNCPLWLRKVCWYGKYCIPQKDSCIVDILTSTSHVWFKHQQNTYSSCKTAFSLQCWLFADSWKSDMMIMAYCEHSSFISINNIQTTPEHSKASLLCELNAVSSNLMTDRSFPHRQHVPHSFASFNPL